MSVLSVRQVGRIAVGALSLLSLAVACAEGTNTDDVPIGGVAGNTATGGTDSATSGSPSGGSATPMAGTTSTPTAGKGGGSGTGGTVAMAGRGGVGGAGGSAGSGGGGAGGAGGKAGGGAGGKAGGGAGGAAGMAGSGGSAGSGGAVSTGHRYAKLVATTELTGNVWSAVAELQIMTTGNVAISRSGWTVMADSEETDDEADPATAAIDGDNATFWHTAWEPAPNNVNDAVLPHSLIVDMKSAHTVTGFSYLPRQNNPNGRIKDWQFFVSKDGTTWGAAIDTGTFPAGAALQTITF